MENLGYYNGKFDLIENMSVPMNDRACFFGDGLFEVAYVRNRKIYALDEHMERLYKSADILGYNMPITKEDFSALLYELSGKVDSPDQLIYWQVSRGTEMRSHAPQSELTANVWVTVRPKKMVPPYAPMKLITFPDTRFFHCNMKTLNLLPTVMASIAAKEAGADEAIFHRNGTVTECAHSNLCIIRNDGAVQTAPADDMILPGVTRAHMIRACEMLGIPCIEEHFTLEEMMDAAEVVVVTSGAQFRPVCEIDGKSVGGKSPELIKKLQELVYGDFLEKTNA
ncbi:MAG: aminotransferase class IV [Clostridia bacterium]|nr:aminotransferase class IV [Clostridia bacterium]